jgi:hypothetical protein
MAAMERAIRVQQVICGRWPRKLPDGRADIIGISDQQMGPWREGYEEVGFRGLFADGGGSPPQVGPVAVVERVLELCRELAAFSPEAGGRAPDRFSATAG